jgi:hypothetical protein
MKKLILLSCVALTMGACTQKSKENLGLANVAPDEFSVITRAPLSVPPNFEIRPPRPGADRPMEISTRDTARKTVFGVSDVNRDTGVVKSNSNVDGFLARVGVSDTNDDIRAVLDSETPQDTRTTAERLLFMSGNNGTEGKALNPKQELERLETEGVVIKKRNDEIEAP